MALPNSQYGVAAVFDGNEQNTARDGAVDTDKAQALDYNLATTEIKDIADDLLKGAAVVGETTIEDAIIDLDSRITTGGDGDVRVTRLAPSTDTINEALDDAETAATKYTVILIEGSILSGVKNVTITKPTKFIGTASDAEIDLISTAFKITVDFPASSEQSRLEFEDLKISRSAIQDTFDIKGACVLRFNNCVISDEVIVATTLGLFETTSILTIFAKSTIFETTTINGLIFNSTNTITMHLDDSNALNTTNFGTIITANNLILNMSNHSFINQVTMVITLTLTVTYDNSILIDDGEITATTIIIHGIAYYDSKMLGSTSARDAIEDHVKPTTGGRKLLIGPGIYGMTSAATISGSDVEIEGSGPGTILNVTSGTQALTITASDIIVSNLQIHLNATNLRGISIDSGSNQIIKDIIFDSIVGTNNEFIKITGGGNNVLIDKCIGKVTGGTVQQLFFGAAGSGPVTISNCISDEIDGGFRTDIAKTTFTSCYVKSSTNNATLFNVNASDCIVSNCIGEGDGTSPMTGVLVGDDKIKISGCDFKDISIGINVLTLSDNVNISNCTFKLLSSGSLVVNGIVAVSTTSFTASDCIIDGNGNSNAASEGVSIIGTTISMSLINIEIFGLTAGDGILVSNASLTSSDSIISKCRITGVGGVGISIKDMERMTITSCHIRASGSDGILLNGAKECQVSTNHCSGNTGFGINESGAANFNLVGTNHCRGNTGGSVNLVGANSVESDTMS